MLQQKKIAHRVLNAKQHQSEAQIVAEAGLSSAVTIATNMAGRGTDIKLGEGVKAAGGLAIIGTERHESRRVDRQLRGRAGRQGDPGTSQFFVSLEDELMRLFGSERIASLMDKMGHKEGEMLQHSMISNSIERAQKKVEENNFGIRKRLLEYDDVMNAQRNVIYKFRNHALYGDRLAIDLDNAMYDVCQDLAKQAVQTRDTAITRVEVAKHLAFEPQIDEALIAKGNAQAFGEELYQQAKEFYTRKMNSIREQMTPQLREVLEQNRGKVENIVVPFTDGIRGLQVYANLEETVAADSRPVIQELEKNITLSLVDDAWKDHLRRMDELRNSVQMASYEQKDPLLIYKFEAADLFKQMNLEINRTIISFLFRAGIPTQEAPVQAAQLPKQRTDMSDYYDNKAQIDNVGDDYAANERDYYQEPVPQPKQQPVVAGPKIGRNDDCPCGSGKKYKACHGRGL
jgi:preprotein translocase subunit SecA